MEWREHARASWVLARGLGERERVKSCKLYKVYKVYKFLGTHASEMAMLWNRCSVLVVGVGTA